MRIHKRWYIFMACIAIVGIAVWQGFPALSSIYNRAHPSVQANTRGKATATTPIKHIVVIMQEIRTTNSKNLEEIVQ